MFEKVDAHYLARKQPYKMFYSGPNGKVTLTLTLTLDTLDTQSHSLLPGETINKDKFLKVVTPIMDQVPKRMDKAELLKDIQSAMKQRRSYHKESCATS